MWPLPLQTWHFEILKCFEMNRRIGLPPSPTYYLCCIIVVLDLCLMLTCVISFNLYITSSGGSSFLVEQCSKSNGIHAALQCPTTRIFPASSLRSSPSPFSRIADFRGCRLGCAWSLFCRPTAAHRTQLGPASPSALSHYFLSHIPPLYVVLCVFLVFDPSQVYELSL